MTLKKVQLNKIVKNQLPEYVREDFPLVGEFLSAYYKGQEYQGAPIDLVNNIDMFILFKQENKAILTLDYKSFSEQQEVEWSINENYEIVIDDSFNKKINIGSGNNKWILKDDAIFIKNKDEINKNIILQKAF